MWRGRLAVDGPPGCSPGETVSGERSLPELRCRMRVRAQIESDVALQSRGRCDQAVHSLISPKERLSLPAAAMCCQRPLIGARDTGVLCSAPGPYFRAFARLRGPDGAVVVLTLGVPLYPGADFTYSDRGTVERETASHFGISRRVGSLAGIGLIPSPPARPRSLMRYAASGNWRVSASAEISEAHGRGKVDGGKGAAVELLDARGSFVDSGHMWQPGCGAFCAPSP